MCKTHLDPCILLLLLCCESTQLLLLHVEARNAWHLPPVFSRSRPRHASLPASAAPPTTLPDHHDSSFHKSHRSAWCLHHHGGIEPSATSCGLDPERVEKICLENLLLRTSAQSPIGRWWREPCRRHKNYSTVKSAETKKISLHQVSC